MAFLKPTFPTLDLADWRLGTRSDKIRPLTQHLAEFGLGAPGVLHVLYIVKIALYVLGAWAFALTTPGIDGFFAVSSWWSEPIVFQKVVLFSMLFEIVGFGCGFGPLNGRISPPMGSIVYWLKPGTIRLPPWPHRVPLTHGDTRSVADVVLYAVLLVMLVVALCSGGTGSIAVVDSSVGMIPVWKIAVIVALLAVLGLRDRTIFLGARGEVYGSLTVAFLFGGVEAIVAAKLVCLVIWVGAATSKLNQHLPFVMSAMLSNSPTFAPRSLKRRLFKHFPDDLRPSGLSATIAHFATAVEMLAPIALFLSNGGWPTTVAAFVMVCFHLGILSAMPAGVPLEWNVFMILAVLCLFVGHPQIGLSDLTNPIPVVLLVAVIVATVVVGNLFPDKVSFLPGMRYYAGNWDITFWCLSTSARQKFAAGTGHPVTGSQTRMDDVYGADGSDVANHLSYAFRSLNTHGRALFTLLNRAVPPGRTDSYAILDGERICAALVGWNFGDGHLHNEQLLAAVQRRCHFEPGEVRVVMIDAQPIHRQRQRYRLVDAAGGQFESGYVNVADLVCRQPWADDVPVHADSIVSTG